MYIKKTVKPFVLKMIERGELLRLDVGSGKHPKVGFITLDRTPSTDPDILCDLEDLPIPLPDNCVEEVYSNYCIECVSNPEYVVEDIWRVCIPGAVVQINLPHWSWDGAWGDPLHKSHFSEQSWIYWDCRNHVSADWKVKSMFDPIALNMTCDPLLETHSKEEQQFIRQYYRNIIMKMCFILRVVKGDKDTLPNNWFQPKVE